MLVGKKETMIESAKIKREIEVAQIKLNSALAKRQILSEEIEGWEREIVNCIDAYFKVREKEGNKP